MQQSTKTTLIVLGVLLVLITSYLAAVDDRTFGSLGSEPIACTMEAKLCPDGSYVGRGGPLCEFDPCPGESQSGETGDGWKMFVDTSVGASFSYPDTDPAAYISTVDWPPKIEIIEEPFTCTEAGSETARAGVTERRTVGEREYCVTRVTEGAAGSTYTQYAYAFADGERTVILTFSLRFAQCGNFSGAEKAECENEREAFDPDETVDRIARSIRFQ